MNKDNMGKLLGALRSGEYKKGRGTLRMGDEFCAMGVACDLFIKENQDYKWVDEGDDGYVFIGPLASNRMFCPTQVKAWLGLTEYQVDRIVNLNDDHDTFEFACEYIEEMLNAE